MTRYLPAQIFSVSVLTYGYRAVRLDSRASPSGVRMDIPGLGEDRTGYEKMVRGSKRRAGACLGTHARSHHIMRHATFPFHSVFFFPFSLSGPHFAIFCSFVHILLSGTPIDEPFSPTRSTSKHLPIPTILFSFKRSECADLVILSFMSFCLFLVI